MKEAVPLYDRDFFEWTARSAQLLRQGRARTARSAPPAQGAARAPVEGDGTTRFAVHREWRLQLAGYYRQSSDRSLNLFSSSRQVSKGTRANRSIKCSVKPLKRLSTKRGCREAISPRNARSPSSRSRTKRSCQTEAARFRTVVRSPVCANSPFSYWASHWLFRRWPLPRKSSNRRISQPEDRSAPAS
jgi:hypothetical protein